MRLSGKVCWTCVYITAEKSVGSIVNSIYKYQYMSNKSTWRAREPNKKKTLMIRRWPCKAKGVGVGVDYSIGGRLVSSSLAPASPYWPSCCHMLSEYKEALKKVKTRDIFFSSTRSLSIRSTTSPSLVSATNWFIWYYGITNGEHVSQFLMQRWYMAYKKAHLINAFYKHLRFANNGIL